MTIGNKRIAAIALGLALSVSALASPSFAQRSEQHMSAARAAALRECNLKAQKFTQHTWPTSRSTSIGPAWRSMASRNNATSR